MKSIIRISLVLLAAFTFNSCTKIIFENDEPLAGSWILTDAAHKDVYGWYPVTTGVERGVFTFYRSGSATYTEGRVTLRGTWRIYYTSGGYYDEYGNYYYDSHPSLEVNLSDGYGDNINMYFDNVRIYANRFVATNYNSHYIERYRFSRY